MSLYIGITLLLNAPVVQQRMSVFVSSELSQMLGAELRMGRIDMGMLNRIIINDLLLYDRSGHEMLKAARLSAKFDILPLFKGKISISNIQLFGFDIHLEKATPRSASNFQFVIDTFASKDTVPKDPLHLDLRINALLIRRGQLSYHVLSEARTPGRFNTNHLHVRDIIANISLKALTGDTINASIKRMSFREDYSGFRLNRLGLKLIGNKRGLQIANFGIELPRTSLALDTIRMEFDSLSENASDMVRNACFKARIPASHVTLADLKAFVPALSSFQDALRVEMRAEGTLNELRCPYLSVTAGNHFTLSGNVLFQDLAHPNDTYVFGKLTNLRADREGVAFFYRNLNKNNSDMPPVLERMGNVHFTGEISGFLTDLVMYGRVNTDVGTLRTDLKFTSDKEQGKMTYSGSLKTEDFKLGQLLANPKLGDITFNVSVDGQNHAGRYPTIVTRGMIESLTYSDYTYRQITLDGKYQDGGFNGRIALDDPNASLALDGSFNISGQTPTFNMLTRIDHLNPHALHLTPKYEDASISLRIKADFTGGSIDEMDGEINIDSLMFTSPRQDYFMDNFKLTAVRPDETHKRLDIRSAFLTGCVTGEYSYRTLPQSLTRILHRYIPSLVSADEEKGKEAAERTDNNFTFDLHIYNTELLSTVFQVPLTVYTHSTLKGYFSDRLGRIRMEGYFPHLHYKNKFIESGLVVCENTEDFFEAKLRLTNRKENGAVNVSLSAKARNDSLQTVLDWGNSSAVTYSGRLSTTARFAQKSPLTAIVDINPTDVIISDTLWNIHPARVIIDSGKVYVHNFQFTNQKRYLRANGIVSDQSQDTLRLDLKQINIGYIFDIADLGVNFQGDATGPIYASGVLKTPVMTTDLFISGLGINNGLLGDADIRGEWHHDVKGIYLDARIREGDSARTHVNGFIYPIKPTSSLDLQIEAGGTNLKFIHYYMRNITPEFHGRAWGNVHFYGKFKALTMEGKVYGDASMKVDVLGTTYTVRDSITIVPEGLTFNNNRIYDTQGHQGTMNGRLRYNHFKNLSYNFQFDVRDMLLMNTRESLDFPFYGTVYATGNASIAGNATEGVNINVAMTTGRGTTFTYIKDNVSSAISNQFIRFVDKTPRRVTQDSVLLSTYERVRQRMQAEEERENDTDIRLNLIVEATPEATMRIIMDPAAGDYISANGAGSLRTEFYNKGDVRLFGGYRISQGIYKFSLQEVIRKDFLIRDGSTITFNGEPLDAMLDIVANYTVNSASLSDLIPNVGNFIEGQTNVKVNCVMNLTGQLTAPSIKLDLELPNERDEIEALVRNYIPSEEQMSMQILYLLGIGKFYPSETFGTGQNSDMMSSVLSSTLSGQLNNALSQIIDNNNWNVGTNFSTGERGWTDMEFEGMLSGRLLNNRLLINGNFGYRDNPLANTNFVGDFEAEWLVTHSGEIRLKAYNETNDRYYTRTNLTTQGIGIIFQKDFEKWNELMFWKRWKLFRLKSLRPKKEETDTDDENAPKVMPLSPVTP